ncbi:LysR substrate-binding domain-containing protein [Pseudomonas sp. Pseusp122]|uniref:LysR substrate-binding domain-containing protein n=1 Tax=unclassified Pseudomonas TaxID=196821 RepID=UPI0039A676A9
MESAIEALSRLHPEVHLSVVHSSEQNPSLEVLHKDSADILIMPSTTLDDHHLEHHHWRDDYVLVAARSKWPQTRNFYELVQAIRYVSWRHPGVERLHSQLASVQLRLIHRGELSNVDTLLDLVAKGHCLSILPRALLPEAGGAFDYVQLPIPVERRISVIARPTSLLSNAANAVLDILKNKASQL